MVATILVTTLSINAQNDDLRNEIGVYYGFGAASSIVSTVGTAFGSAISGSDQSGFWGPVGVEYYYHVTPVIGVGAIASIAGCNWAHNNDLTTTYITVMPSVKFNWLRKDHFGLYSSLAAGVMIEKNSSKIKGVKDSSTDGNFMWQVCGLGAEVGGQFRGFAELGFGEKGVLCVGLRYKF